MLRSLIVRGAIYVPVSSTPTYTFVLFQDLKIYQRHLEIQTTSTCFDNLTQRLKCCIEASLASVTVAVLSSPSKKLSRRVSSLGPGSSYPVMHCLNSEDMGIFAVPMNLLNAAAVRIATTI
jgi:hypothetical protein